MTMPARQFTISLAPDDAIRLEHIAAQTGVSATDYLQKLIDDNLAAPPTPAVSTSKAKRQANALRNLMQIFSQEKAVDPTELQQLHKEVRREHNAEYKARILQQS